MQFFHLFSFVVVASYAAALPQPAGLSEKYSDSADTNLAFGLETRSYQPGSNSHKDSATLVSLKRRDDSEGSDPSPPSAPTPKETVGKDFTKDDVSSENLASTIDKVRDDAYIFFKEGEEVADKIGGTAGDLIRKYFRSNAYVSTAIRRWVQASVPGILDFIESGLGEAEYFNIEPEFSNNLYRLRDKFRTELNATVDDATKILNNVGSDIENVQNISKSFKRVLSDRLELLEALKVQLLKFGNGTTLGGQLANVAASVNKFLEKQYGLHEEMMQALTTAPSQ
ncbi:hypothetical protein BASA50_004058 [Batrachochytrium salamandrivorans]|uniref:Secreted protein n=1 Tax=Batrachochytrium salamandrivorans TaxID=1357716 RepID=A0ABQ8FGP1_9FUNG|nr:hypothetical protein BASA50_004058 [Batrachochytrium salamandrivorans]KAH9246381.1 hypothetical protein BASA81_016071 [Batrachochytrium salamandrivorans]KAH9277135.1 hypothetical protein BASA83_000662 [Batrachochytrium salamandrivorans]